MLFRSILSESTVRAIDLRCVVAQRDHGCARGAQHDEQTGPESERVRSGLRDILLGPAQLYEALRSRAEATRGDDSILFAVRNHTGLNNHPQLDSVVRRVNQILLRAKVPLGCLHRCVAQ